MRSLLVNCLLAGLLCCAWIGNSQAFDTGLADFTVQIGNKSVDYQVLAVSAMPGEKVPVSVVRPGDRTYSLRADEGIQDDSGSASWEWTAPKTPGHYLLRVQRDDGEAVDLRVFVLRPGEAAREGILHGYRIGHYPEKPLRGDPIYQAPDGFIEVTEAMADLPVSPHFTLGQFLCKQQPDHWPKYLLLRTALLVKLETLLAEANRRGIHTDTFFVMSGYRTPTYNKAIGNVAYSRHLWGGAVDVFVDNDGDGVMDDLNADGRHDIADAKVLHRTAEDLADNGIWKRLLGGLGLYGPRPHRGSFVHVDARGKNARWEMP